MNSLALAAAIVGFVGSVFQSAAQGLAPGFLPRKLTKGCWPWSKGAFANSIGGASKSSIGWSRIVGATTWAVLALAFGLQVMDALRP